MMDPGHGIASGRTLRIGVVNLMPRLETYEPSLRALFASSGRAVEPVWIRLATHAYRSSDPEHLAAHYRSYERALGDGPLDGLVLTGAPVEHLPLAEVRYWPELSRLLDDARARLPGTLGICWGAMALAEREGVRREVFARKVFGVFHHATTPYAGALLGLDGDAFACPQSRFAGFEHAEVAQAERAGRVMLLGDGGEAGPTLLATPDGRVVMHLGHPEYDAPRLGYEWRRDAAAGRTDVDPPRGYDLERDRPELDWSGDSAAFMRGWLDRLG
jgi:homoserine O-succinyltransferase